MRRFTVYLTAIAVLLAAAGGCKNPFTPKLDDIEQFGEELPDEWLLLTSHSNVMKNFLFVYNFREKQLSANDAIEYYTQLFQPDGAAYQYEYQILDPLDPDKLPDPEDRKDLTEELTNTESLFENVESYGLYMTLSLRNNNNATGYTIERKETPDTGHEGEDWYVYNYDTRLELENPSGFPYLVEGEVIFKIRLCEDGLYRIIRWQDLTDPFAQAK